MKKLLLLLIIPFLSFGQGWEQIFCDYYIGNSVQQTTDGGYIITGVTGFVGSDVVLLKTNSNGEEEWSQTFGEEENIGPGWNEDFGHTVQQTTDGGYIICGITNSFDGEFAACLIKTNGNGQEEWVQTFPGYTGTIFAGSGPRTSVQQTIDGGYILCGGNLALGLSLIHI